MFFNRVNGKSQIIFVSIVSVLLVVSSQVYAATIFSKSYSGLDLVNLSEVSTPSGYTPNGNSVQLRSDYDYHPVLEWSLLDAAERSDVHIHVAIDYTAIGIVDNDPRFMISDAVNAQGIARVDNNNNAAYITSKGIDGSYQEDAEFANSLNNASNGLSLSFDLLVSDDGTATTLSGYSELGYTQLGDISYQQNFIDSTKALSFIIMSGDNDEAYEISLVFVEITSVPEPTTLGLLGLGGVLLTRRRH